MRHNKNFNHLGRQAGHRKAMLSNMATSLILHKRIETTVAKAKAVQRFVEPLVTKSKEDTTHSRRIVFSYLKQKEAVTELFRTIAPKISERPGGYTRILKTGFRLGDAADMCIIEFVDFNEPYTLGIAPAAASEAKPKTRRSRKSAAKATDWIAPWPGTDAALGLAMLKTIVDEKLYDEEFLLAHTCAPCLVDKATGEGCRPEEARSAEGRFGQGCGSEGCEEDQCGQKNVAFWICKRIFPHILNKTRMGRPSGLPIRVFYYDARKIGFGLCRA